MSDGSIIHLAPDTIEPSPIVSTPRYEDDAYSYGYNVTADQATAAMAASHAAEARVSARPLHFSRHTTRPTCSAIPASWVRCRRRASSAAVCTEVRRAHAGFHPPGRCTGSGSRPRARRAAVPDQRAVSGPLGDHPDRVPPSRLALDGGHNPGTPQWTVDGLAGNRCRVG